MDEKLLSGLKRRLQPVKSFNIDEAKNYLESLCIRMQELNVLVKSHYAEEFELWMNRQSLHPLQKIVWKKQIDMLKDIS